ncbi:MAG: hypothetical protein ACOC1F_13045 [Myxococcota bacterium]
MDSPNSFRQAPKRKERLLDPEQVKAQNEALARQVDRAQHASWYSRDPNRPHVVWVKGQASVPWRYMVPVVLGAGIVWLSPFIGVPTDKSLLIGALTALILFVFAFIQDVNRWLSK